jgi:anti-anti-sigma regulatory factor
MAADVSARLEAFNTGSGRVVRLIGRGTMLESRAFHRYASHCLETAPPAASFPYLTLDLAECPRLDSTFLGCLVDLHRRYNCGDNPRFALAAEPPRRTELFGACRLDRLLPLLDAAPPVWGEGKSLVPGSAPGQRELGEHVLECHLRLAQENCPGKEAYASVAERLEKELAAQRS